ncbi:MAG: hypothetical protein NUV65_06090 [Candidatus Roizmanbacteria bacterium]|nr:hypothetical protein [Candidatus Roizmanbacteria bacterium]
MANIKLKQFPINPNVFFENWGFDVLPPTGESSWKFDIGHWLLSFRRND